MCFNMNFIIAFPPDNNNNKDAIWKVENVEMRDSAGANFALFLWP